LSKAGYIADLQTTEWAAKDLLTFLSLVRNKSGADRVHVIAHSMGNKLLAEAVARVGDPKEAERNKLNEIILTAPDIDVDVFKRDFVKPLVAFAERVTLYASSNDLALKESRRQAGHYQRAGESNPTILIAPGVESIDASAVDTNLIGHFYYADNGSVISDIFYLFRDGKGANDRYLKKRMLGNDRYWLLKP
jgi:esterase/lipase superfamily enzyme